MENIYMPKDHMEKLYNSKNPLVSFVHRSKLNRILDLIRYEQRKLRDAGRLLDAGCGEGHLLSEIHKIRPDLKLFGIDATDIAVESAKERNPSAKIVCDDLLNLTKNFKEIFFDIIVCSEVLEHIPQYEEVIGNIERCIKAGGLIIITFPNERNLTIARFFLGRKPVKVPDHINEFDPYLMQNHIRANEVYHKNYPFNLPFSISIGAVMGFRRWVE